MTAPAASAGPPSDVADLVGARGAGGESELGRRGYSYVTMSHGTQYWWNAERSTCVGIKVANGRYKSVDAASASRCGQKAAKAGSSRPSGNAESACMTGVNGKYDGNVRNLKVLSSEFSQANSVVMILAEGVRGGSANERWLCLVSNDGKVQEPEAAPALVASTAPLRRHALGRARNGQRECESAPSHVQSLKGELP